MNAMLYYSYREVSFFRCCLPPGWPGELPYGIIFNMGIPQFIALGAVLIAITVLLANPGLIGRW